MSLPGATKKRISRLKTALSELEAYGRKKSIAESEASELKLAILHVNRLIKAEKSA